MNCPLPFVRTSSDKPLPRDVSLLTSAPEIDSPSALMTRPGNSTDGDADIAWVLTLGWAEPVPGMLAFLMTKAAGTPINKQAQTTKPATCSLVMAMRCATCFAPTLTTEVSAPAALSANAALLALGISE